MTSSYAQLRKDVPRLIAMHANLIKPGAAMWRKAEAEREHKKRHAAAIALEQERVGALCLDTAADVLSVAQWAILGLGRKRKIKNARHIAMTVAYELSGLSTIALGKLFNRTRHMILHAQRRVNSSDVLRAQADKVVAAVKKELRKR